LPLPENKLARTLRLISAVLVLTFFLAVPAESQSRETQTKIHALLVVAHPDDEYEMAGTIYHLAKELLGTVDQLIITDGEAGFRYSSLAEGYYGLKLTDEADGRRELPRIRREEAHRSARVLGIEHQWFLNEKDEHFTLDANEVLENSWNRKRVLKSILERLRQGHYDYVFVLLPVAETHGAHKAASILTMEAVAELPAELRPAVLGAHASPTSEEDFTALLQFPTTQTVERKTRLHFDRDARFGYNNALTYQIVVDWVIAEHKSQGLFQNRCRQDRFENFWVFREGRNLPDGKSEMFSGQSHNEGRQTRSKKLLSLPEPWIPPTGAF
jgi:LmbE family N-acetylglucosaminyl deacetylase